MVKTKMEKIDGRKLTFSFITNDDVDKIYEDNMRDL